MDILLSSELVSSNVSAEDDSRPLFRSIPFLDHHRARHLQANRRRNLVEYRTQELVPRWAEAMKGEDATNTAKHKPNQSV